tara:strand:- start:509 stop:889 length:381 start_codon:yes stop_codon:yes gene_type:complete
MKNNIEKVYSKLPKKKLSLKSKKVVLGASDMYENAVSGSKILGMVYENDSELRNIKVKYQSRVEISKDWLATLESDMDDFSVKAKELGINPSDQDFYKYSENVVDEALSTIQYAEEIITALDNLGV